MILDHSAIYKAYPEATRIDDALGAFKTDGTQITLVQSDIDAARAALVTLYGATEKDGVVTLNMTQYPVDPNS